MNGFNYRQYSQNGRRSSPNAFHHNLSPNNLRNFNPDHQADDSDEYEPSEEAINSNDYSEPPSATQSDLGHVQTFSVGFPELSMDGADPSHRERTIQTIALMLR